MHLLKTILSLETFNSSYCVNSLLTDRDFLLERTANVRDYFIAEKARVNHIYFKIAWNVNQKNVLNNDLQSTVPMY